MEDLHGMANEVLGNNPQPTQTRVLIPQVNKALQDGSNSEPRSLEHSKVPRASPGVPTPEV